MSQDAVIDFDKTAEDYATYRLGFPPELLKRLRPFGVGTPHQRVVDLGTGTGTLARQFAAAGADVIGLDPAKALLDKARELDRAAGVKVDYRFGIAEKTGLPDKSVDVVTAGQCWNWFDRRRAAAEIHRILKPGGALVIAHFDWIPLPGNVVAQTEEIILKHNPHWALAGRTGLYPAWLSDLALGGFCSLETFSFDLDISYSHVTWRGRVRASAGVAATLSSAAVSWFDEDLSRVLREKFPQDPLDVPHRTWALIGRAPEVG